MVFVLSGVEHKGKFKGAGLKAEGGLSYFAG
jgi:hypothetical protein